MDSYLLSVLACPEEHHADLTHDDVRDILSCTECHREFAVVDGIPVLLGSRDG